MGTKTSIKRFIVLEGASRWIKLSLLSHQRSNKKDLISIAEHFWWVLINLGNFQWVLIKSADNQLRLGDEFSLFKAVAMWAVCKWDASRSALVNRRTIIASKQQINYFRLSHFKIMQIDVSRCRLKLTCFRFVEWGNLRWHAAARIECQTTKLSGCITKESTVNGTFQF